MDLKELCELKSRFVTRVVGNELLLVPLTGSIAQMNEMFTLNATARFIWEQTSEQTTLNDLVIGLTEHFDIDETSAASDVIAFVEKLKIMLLKHS